MTSLVVIGARQHNLRNVDCELPRDRLVVITGPSGSGKSSLAFDTIYAEGQRRYVESLSAYARQFLRQLPKPDVDSIEGLSPSIAIDQRNLGSNPRSTVGTVTELSDYLRLLFARIGTPHCPVSGKALKANSVQEIVDSVLEREDGSRLLILAPIARRVVSDLTEHFEDLRARGFVRARIDGQTVELSQAPEINPTEPHDLEVVVDRIVVRSDAKNRITDSVELALELGSGTVLLDALDGAPPTVMSNQLVSWEHGITLPPLEPRLFSFNSAHGACPACEGLGLAERIDADAVVTDAHRSLREGAIAGLGRRGSVARSTALAQLVKAVGVNPDTPWQDLDAKVQRRVLRGVESKKKAQRFEGVIPMLERLCLSDPEEAVEMAEDGAMSPEEARLFLRQVPCEACAGRRLRPEALAVTLGDQNIAQLGSKELSSLLEWLNELAQSSSLEPSQKEIALPLIAAMAQRLNFLAQVGLGTLTLNRRTSTVSGGEGQRIRLATQLGAALVGVLYVLDEPSVGLHPKDHSELLAALRKLVDKGNSVVVVEHDRDTIEAADYIVDMGPGAGTRGGTIVARGSLSEILASKSSVTAPYLRNDAGKRRHPLVSPGSEWVRVHGAKLHNLKALDVEFPIGLMTAVTGVSGSGKSSLVLDVLLAAARAELYGRRHDSTQFDSIAGLDNFDRCVSVDQKPIGRTPRSNPATYTGVFALLRELYAGLPEARARGYKAGRFSFNVKGGRCEKCKGDGLLRVELSFLPDMYVQCDACDGRRYNRETLELRYRGLSIADALELTVEEASELFRNLPKLAQRLDGLRHIGLGYIQLGQPATTLSGGESQRLRLAAELWKRGTGRTLYVLDEPTTGLHFSDIELLLSGLVELRDAGNTVVLIEHNMDLVAQSDWVIDLGPEGGRNGGQVVATGTPRDIANARRGHTATHLARALEQS